MAGARESLPVHRIAVQDDTVLLVMAGVGGDGHNSVDTSGQVLEPGEPVGGKGEQLGDKVEGKILYLVGKQ